MGASRFCLFCSLPDKSGAERKEQKQGDNSAAYDEIAVVKPFDGFLGGVDVVVNGIELFIVDVLGPHVGHIHVPDQLVQSQAKVVAEQDQPLEVGVGLTGFPNLKR